MSCKTGSATNIIYGLALGYKSTIVPVFVLAAIIYTSFDQCGTYGACVRVCVACVTLHGARCWDLQSRDVGLTARDARRVHPPLMPRVHRAPRALARFMSCGGLLLMSCRFLRDSLLSFRTCLVLSTPVPFTVLTSYRRQHV